MHSRFHNNLGCFITFDVKIYVISMVVPEAVSRSVGTSEGQNF